MKMKKEIYVKIAEVKIGSGDSELKITLGSCVCIIFFDKIKNQTAAAHCLLPYGEVDDEVLSGRYVNVAIKSLKTLLHITNESKKYVDVSVIGGANMMSSIIKSTNGQVGNKNSEMAIKLLEEEGFHIKFQDLGGEHARQVTVCNESGETTITTLYKDNSKQVIAI